MKAILLILFLVYPNGELEHPQVVPVSSIEECWKRADSFVREDPKKYSEKATGLGAGCVIATLEPEIFNEQRESKK